MIPDCPSKARIVCWHRGVPGAFPRESVHAGRGGVSVNASSSLQKRDSMNCLTIIAPIALLLVACVTQPAEAYRVKRHDTQSSGCSLTNEGRQVCGGPVADRTAIPNAARTRLASRAEARDATGNRVVLTANEGTIIGGRPSGCPHSYCGCGLRMHLGLLGRQAQPGFQLGAALSARKRAAGRTCRRPQWPRDVY